MTITPGNLSMLLALASSIAPGTWAVVAGVAGVAVGYFGKNLLKKNESLTSSSDSCVTGQISRRDATRRAANPRRRKKNPPASGN
jgi:hypothetical protein